MEAEVAKATILTPNEVGAEVTLAEPNNGTDFSLEEMQQIVGGYIEIICLKESLVMVIYEEGKFAKKPINIPATHLCHQHEAISKDDYIVGTALVCPADQVR